MGASEMGGEVIYVRLDVKGKREPYTSRAGTFPQDAHFDNSLDLPKSKASSPPLGGVSCPSPITTLECFDRDA